jgi:hypothetical protein
MDHLIFVLILLLAGGFGLACATLLPAHYKLDSDNCVGIGLLGLVWLIVCAIFAGIILHLM